MAPKSVSTGNRSLLDFFKSKPNEPPAAKRPRIEAAEKPLSPSPTPTSSPATLVASSAEPNDVGDVAAADVNASFASMRSTSSKRVTTSSGQQAIMGSDSDTDEGLEDLDTILNRAKSKPKAKPATLGTKPAGITKFTSNVVSKKEVKKKYQFSLSKLVEEQAQQTAMEVKIAEAQANFHSAGTETAPSADSPDKTTIKAVLTESKNAEDGGKARRVLDALERTDAFERHDVWNFFEEQPVKRPRNPFPRISHSNAVLKNTLNDPERRRQAFATGFIQRIAEKIPLPDELLTWLMTEACRERKETLLSAYADTLAQAADSESSCLSSANLNRCFRLLGARAEALDHNSIVQRSRVDVNAFSGSVDSTLPPFLDLLRKLCYRMPISSKDTLAHFLIRASFDHGVSANVNARTSVENCFRTLLDSYPQGEELDEAFSRLSKATFESIRRPTLRKHLIYALPASTPSTHYFRRSLAVAFALERDKYLNTVLTNSALTGRLVLLFDKGSALRVKKDTDYVELRARLSLLDMAVDVGFSDFAFMNDQDKQAERHFNESIDRLGSSIRELSARIVDAGAAHMTRTEAKVVAERVVQRLEFAVRTREKPPKDWFGAQDRQEKQEFMKTWTDSKQSDPVSGTDSAAAISSATKSEAPAITISEACPAASVEQRAGTETPNTSHPASPMKKIAMRGSSLSPTSKKGKNPMVLMRF